MYQVKKIQFQEESYSLSEDQLALLKKTTLREFSFNFDLSNKLYQNLLSQLAHGYLNEGDVSKFVLRIIRQGDIVADIGANIGFYTSLLASMVGPTGTVYAFEAAKENIDAIHANIELNQFSQVHVHHCLLGDDPQARANFFYNVHDSGTSYASKHSDHSEGYASQMMPMTLLDDFLKNQSLKLVKIDVEGFEVAVLRGATELLQRNAVKYWIVEYAPHCLRRNGESLDSLRSLMRRFGYELFVLDYEGGFPKYYPPNVFIGGRWLNNLLFAKPLE